MSAQGIDAVIRHAKKWIALFDADDARYLSPANEADREWLSGACGRRAAMDRTDPQLSARTGNVFANVGGQRPDQARVRTGRGEDAFGDCARSCRAQESRRCADQLAAVIDAEGLRRYRVATNAGDDRVFQQRRAARVREGRRRSRQAGVCEGECKPGRCNPGLRPMAQERSDAESVGRLRNRRRRVSADAQRRRHGRYAARSVGTGGRQGAGAVAR